MSHSITKYSFYIFITNRSLQMRQHFEKNNNLNLTLDKSARVQVEDKYVYKLNQARVKIGQHYSLGGNKSKLMHFIKVLVKFTTV